MPTRASEASISRPPPWTMTSGTSGFFRTSFAIVEASAATRCWIFEQLSAEFHNHRLHTGNKPVRSSKPSITFMF